MSLELVFPSDTNQQLAESMLLQRDVQVSRGAPGALDIDRTELVSRMPDIEDVLSEFGGRIWAD